MELDMWIITLIAFCVILVENITTLIQAITNGNPLFSFYVFTMFVSICMICTSIIQICVLA